MLSPKENKLANDKETSWLPTSQLLWTYLLKVVLYVCCIIWSMWHCGLCRVSMMVADGLAAIWLQDILALIQYEYTLLTHWSRVSHICVCKLTIIVTWPAPSHYLNQCWNIVNWTLRNKLQWDLNRNSLTFSSEKMRSKVSSVKRQPFCLSLNVLTA